MLKDLKSCESGEIGCLERILAALVGKDWKSCEWSEIYHSE